MTALKGSNGNKYLISFILKQIEFLGDIFIKASKMKTSTSQLEFMVSFMERHGDLTKPTSSMKDRLAVFCHWEELVSILHTDTTGDTKSLDKWKKVWSDLKNNTKKKAARHKKADGIPGRVMRKQLTDLDKRLLSLINTPNTKGITDADSCASLQEITVEVPPSSEIQLLKPEPPAPEALNTVLIVPEFEVSRIKEYRESLDESGPYNQTFASTPSSQPNPESSSLVQVKDEIIDDDEDLNEEISCQEHVAPILPTLPAHFGQTKCRNIRPPRIRPLRPVSSPITRKADRHFVQSEKEWRQFLKNQHRDNLEMRREKNRIREKEVQVQKEWQVLSTRALDILDKLANKYNKD